MIVRGPANRTPSAKEGAKKARHLACRVLIGALGIALASRAEAATITWTGGGGTSSWHSAANWDLARVPEAGDDVVIPDMSPDVNVTYFVGQHDDKQPDQRGGVHAELRHIDHRCRIEPQWRLRALRRDVDRCGRCNAEWGDDLDGRCHVGNGSNDH